MFDYTLAGIPYELLLLPVSIIVGWLKGSLRKKIVWIMLSTVIFLSYPIMVLLTYFFFDQYEQNFPIPIIAQLMITCSVMLLCYLYTACLYPKLPQRFAASLTRHDALVIACAIPTATNIVLIAMFVMFVKSGRY